MKLWHLSGQPYEVQLEAMRRSAGHDRYGYFLEQGLGKTALILNEYIDRYTHLDTVFTICPNSFKMDWKLAGPEWGIDSFTYSVWPEPFKTGTAGAPHFNIINFEAARTGRIYTQIKNILDKRPCALIVDESSAIKNFKSLTAKMVGDLCKRAKMVRLLNGTPMVQNVMDLFPQLKCLGQLDGVNPYVFKHRFGVLGGYMGKQIIGVKNEKILQMIQTKCSFRALKRDWADLPEKMPATPVHLQMTLRQKQAYQEMLSEFYTMVKGEEFDASMVLTQADKLRQISSGVLLRGEMHVLIDPPYMNPKLRAILDVYHSGPGKMIIAYFYRATGDMVFSELNRLGYQPAMIRGQMQPDEIIEQKRRFTYNPECRFMLGQYTAASKGHTLLGGEGEDRCSRMYFFDGTFSLLDRAQMEDRIHRGAQDRACQYYDPILSPIDQAQLNALTKKKDIAASIVDAVRAMKGRLKS